MKDYSKMSDFEINKEVATLMCGSECVVGHAQRKVIITTGIAGYVLCHFDPCNNPSDALPIMKESLIGVTPDEDGVTMHFYGDWTARAHCKNLQFTDKNPLRAVMIVYLMMKDEEK